LFNIYLVLLILIVLLKFDGTLNFSYVKAIRQSLLESSELNINLILFDTIKPYLNMISHQFAFKNIVGNILAFVPLGFFMSILFFRKNIIKTFFGGVLVILFIESIQLVTKIGFFDVDDILLNSIGILIGYIISLVFLKI
ncbi:MAG: VanZ family protein, partial [bacterium]